MTLRICLDISAALSQTAGIGRYARELALALHTLAETEGLAISLLHNRQPLANLPAALRPLPRSEIPLGNKVWRACALAGLPLPRGWTRSAHDADLYHGLDLIAPNLPQPTVITIHDLTALLFGQYHTRFNRVYQRLALPIMARRAGAVIADSESTRQDIITRLGVKPHKVHTVHLGVDQQRFTWRPPAAAAEKVRTLHAIEQPYILALGTLEPRKNLTTLLAAFAQLPDDGTQLVLVGKQGWGDLTVAQAVEQMGLQGRVRILGFVADELLPDLYAAATVFVYPSLYEGFGLPLLEAMACGAPVIASNSSSLPEVGGTAARYVHPTDTQELAATMAAVLHTPDLQQELRAGSIAQAARFTWSATAAKTLAIYREVVDSAKLHS